MHSCSNSPLLPVTWSDAPSEVKCGQIWALAGETESRGCVSLLDESFRLPGLWLHPLSCHSDQGSMCSGGAPISPDPCGIPKSRDTCQLCQTGSLSKKNTLCHKSSYFHVCCRYHNVRLNAAPASKTFRGEFLIRVMSTEIYKPYRFSISDGGKLLERVFKVP